MPGRSDYKTRVFMRAIVVVLLVGSLAGCERNETPQKEPAKPRSANDTPSPGEDEARRLLQPVVEEGDMVRRTQEARLVGELAEIADEYDAVISAYGTATDGEKPALAAKLEELRARRRANREAWQKLTGSALPDDPLPSDAVRPAPTAGTAPSSPPR